MTQSNNLPKRWLVPYPEKKSRAGHPCQIACGGSQKMGYLLEYFLTEASWELERQNLPESCNVVVLTCSHKDIFEKVKVNISHKSLIDFLKTFNEWGFVLNERYGKQYTVQAGPIREAMYNPKSCKVYPAASTFLPEEVLQRLEDLETKSCNVEVKFTQLQHYNFALEARIEAMAEEIEALKSESCNVYPNVEALQHYNFSSDALQAASNTLDALVPFRDIERESIRDIRDSSLSSSTFVPDDANDGLPVAMDSGKDTDLQTEQGEDDDTQPFDNSVVHDPAATDGHVDPYLQAMQDIGRDDTEPEQTYNHQTAGREQGLNGFRESMAMGNDLEETVPRIQAIRPQQESESATHEHPSTYPSVPHSNGAYHPDSLGATAPPTGLPEQETTQALEQTTPSTPGVASLPSAVASSSSSPESGDQGETYPLALSQTNPPAETPPGDDAVTSGTQQVSRPEVPSTSLTPGQHVGPSDTGSPASLDVAQVEQVYTTTEEWEAARKQFLEGIHATWGKFTKPEKTALGGKWQSYEKEQRLVWEKVNPRPVDKPLEEACRTIYSKITTEWRGYEWSEGGAVRNEHLFIRNYVLKYRGRFPDPVKLFHRVYIQLTTKHIKYSSDSYSNSVSAKIVYDETEAVLQLWKKQQQGASGNTSSYNGNGYRSHQEPTVIIRLADKVRSFNGIAAQANIKH